MRLPRRVPWASLAELDQLCSYIYARDAHDSSRDLAIERLSAWRFTTPLPHALESLLSILVAVRQDNASDVGLSSSLSLRQSYATALIRLVNGLVDPLQSGTYARSILSIAAQIGLPAWLVELRHAATHEDLPSLELLRDGAKESLTWLLHNYFLPTLNPSPTTQAQAHSSPSSIRPVEPLLRRYKNLLKTVSRDASLRAHHAADISGVLREIERWLAEARVAASVHASSHAHTIEFASSSHRGRNAGEPVAAAVGDGGDAADDGDDEEPEPREAWALDRLCDALLVKGALVPISRKKRVSSKGSLHHPPSSLLMIWIPLLESVAADHAHFPAVLTSHVITHLLSSDDDYDLPADEPELEPDDTNATTATATAAGAAEKASYDVCLANWATWLIEWRRSADETDADVTARRQSVFFQLAQALSVTNPNHKKLKHEQQEETPPKSQTGARALFNALCASDSRLAGISNAICSVDTTRRVSENDAPVWRETDLDVMEARVNAARSLSTPRGDISAVPDFSPAEERSLGHKIGLPSGWRLLSEQRAWRTCPIGVYTNSNLGT